MSENRKYYLAFDIGTTNWKAAVFDENGALIDMERTAARTYQDAQGYSCYDPEEVWRTACDLSRRVIGRTGRRIAGVSVTSMAEAVVPIDRDGNTAGKMITWFDIRAMEQAKQLKEMFGEERLYRITGLDVNPIFSLPKILWIKEHCPQVYEKTHKWLQMSDYILFRLTGEAVTDYTLASRTLAFDVTANRWSEEILNRVGVPIETLPAIWESGTVIGRIGQAIEEQTGIHAGALAVVGGNDHPCASIAAGVIHGDKILDSSGTAEPFIYISAKGEAPCMEFRGQRTCRYLEKDRYALWGGIISSGGTFNWAYDTFVSSRAFGVEQKPYTYEEILGQLREVTGIESGLFFYPHLRGAGAPYWNPKITGSFLGIRDIHTSRHMLRAVLEGLSMQAKMIVDMEEKLAGKKVDALCVVGGGSHNILWQTIKASVLQKPVELCYEAEATALGAAMLAAVGDGVYGDISQASGKLAAGNRLVEPDEGLVKRYRGLYELYREGYEQMETFSERIYDEVRR
jgi:xylulokinase